MLAVDEVLRELERKDDEVHEWASRHPDMFVPLEPAIQQRATAIINQFPSLTNPAGTRGKADAFVIAHAAGCGLTVVTAEGSKPTKPKIPDVCRILDVPCIDLVDMFRREGWRV